MCKKFKRDSVLIYKSVFNVIRQLPYDQRWATLEAIIMYGLEGAAAPLTGLPQAIFELAVPLIDANNRRYAKRAGLDPACYEPSRRSEMYAPYVSPEYTQTPQYMQVPEYVQPAPSYPYADEPVYEQPAPREQAAPTEYIQQAPNYVPKAAPVPKTAPAPRSAPTPKAAARGAYAPDYVPNAPTFVINPVDDPMATPYACTTPVGEPYISLDSANVRAAPKIARGAYAPDYVPSAPSFVINTIDDSGVPLSAADGDVLQRESLSRPFVPPTVEQVAKYCASSGLNVNAQRFVDFYASKGWLVGNSPMRCWQASVRKWSESPVAPSGRAAAQLKQSNAFVGGTPCEQRSYTEEELNALFTPLEET